MVIPGDVFYIDNEAPRTLRVVEEVKDGSVICRWFVLGNNGYTLHTEMFLVENVVVKPYPEYTKTYRHARRRDYET